MALNTDCWIVVFSDSKRVEAPISKNAHEVLFIACSKTGQVGRMTKITSVFRNEYLGNRHRNRKAKGIN